jgi:RNA polymerase sigma factor (sigma-70 family)
MKKPQRVASEVEVARGNSVRSSVRWMARRALGGDAAIQPGTKLMSAGGFPLETTEEKLMARYVAGDEVAFRDLFALFAPKLRAFFFRSFLDTALADDLTQTTFLKLHRARASYCPGLPLKPWLFTIAASVRRDELRRIYRLPPHVGEAELEQAEPPSPDKPNGLVALDSNNEVDAVRAAIDRLPESQRAVLHLHCHEELTFEQIAQVLGTTPGAVRVRASRAYERLRRGLRPATNRR